MSEDKAVEIKVEIKPIDDVRQWWAVIGYRNGRIEVLDGNDFRENPVSLKFGSDNPDDPIWVHAIDKEKDECPNKTTAVYKAAMGIVPADAIAKLLSCYLNNLDWELEKDGFGDITPDQAEEIDRFLVDECGEESVFDGLKKVENKETVEWVSQ